MSPNLTVLMKTKHRKKEQVTKRGKTFGAVSQSHILWESSDESLLNVNMLIGCPELHGQSSHLVPGASSPPGDGQAD